MEIKIYAPKARGGDLVSRYDLIDALAYAMWDEDNYPFVPTQVRVVSVRNEKGEIETLAHVTGMDLNGPNKQPRARVYSPTQAWRAPEWLHRMVEANQEAFDERFPDTPQEG